MNSKIFLIVILLVVIASAFIVANNKYQCKIGATFFSDQIKSNADMILSEPVNDLPFPNFIQ